MVARVNYKKLLQFRAFANTVANMKEIEDVAIVVKLQKLAKKVCKPLEDFEEMVDDLRIDHCAKENGRIVRVNNEYQWTAEGEKAFKKAYKELVNHEIDVDYDSPFSFAELMKTMTDPKISVLNDWEEMSPILHPFFVEK